MSKSHAEIKAIEAQIRSIRANPGQPVRTPPTVNQSLVTSPAKSMTTANSRRQSAAQTLPRQSGASRPVVQPTAQPAMRSKEQPIPHSKEQSTTQSTQAMHKLHQGQTAPSLPPLTATPPPATQNFCHAELAAMVERLQQQTARHVQQYHQLQAQSFQPPSYILDRSLQILEAQVQHINHLSAVQEAAILELKTMAETLERGWDAMILDRGEDDELESLPICEYIDVAVPQIEQDEDGVYMLCSRSIDLFKAEREAALTAQALRHWGNREKTRAKPTKLSWRWLQNFVPSSNGARKSDRLPPPSQAQPIHSSGQRSRQVAYFNWRESVALFVGALVVRMSLDWLLVTFSLPWIPAIALLVTPAAIAVYRTSHRPHYGLVWTCRLLIIMIGLLLGGKLL